MAVHFSIFRSVLGACLLTGFSAGELIEFSGLGAGNLPGSDWDESGNLFQIDTNDGIGNSPSLTLSPQAQSSYRLRYRKGVAGTSYSVRAGFRMTINSAQPDRSNHLLIGVTLSTSPEVDEGEKLAFRLLRRNDGKSYGVAGIGDDAQNTESWRVTGWEDNDELGLPNTLPGSSAVSNWFFLELTIEPAGGSLWNVEGRVIDTNGSVLYSHSVNGRTLPDGFIAGQELYGGIAVPWVSGDDYSPLITGGVTRLQIDNFEISSEVPPKGELPPHGITMNPSTLDLDQNGYSDLWENLYRVSNLLPHADADADGETNLAESLAGTDPYDPQSFLRPQISPLSSTHMRLTWPTVFGRPGELMVSRDLGMSDPWTPIGTPATTGSEWLVILPSNQASAFFQLRATETDEDSDGVPDWLENEIGSDLTSANSIFESRPYDTTGNGAPDTTLSGDLAAFNEVYRYATPDVSPTRAQAARFLIQTTFGPANQAEVDAVVNQGYASWIDEQIELPKSRTSQYILDIKTDFLSGGNNSSVSGYAANDNFVFGLNYQTAWVRNAIKSRDQLRQRVAFALSEILVASLDAAMLANQPQAIADYYDIFVDNAFGNYEDILMEVTLHPVMGHFLSHLENEKANPAIGRYPDENYAREVMQLFSIGLWQLNPDGSRILDAQGEPIPTYDNSVITEVARVFTGVGYNANNFGSGWRDDNYYMTNPMKLFASHHDFQAKRIPSGNGTFHLIPARSATDRNAMQDVEDTISTLFNHSNTPPFISRQLIQFLVTANPTPEYIERVSTVFANNGKGERGDLEAVIKAILLDEEARNPMEHLRTKHFGGLREPLIRYMHLARLANMQRIFNLRWWNWPNDSDVKSSILQAPMSSPTVFNYFRPDYRMRGQLSDRGLDAPVFGITDSYAAISVPNFFWDFCVNGQRQSGRYDHDPDWTHLRDLATDIPALLDHLSLLVTGGTMSASTREHITTALEGTTSRTERARLGVFLSIISPEGASLK
ncbi:MAG: DUF1800 domain-containing protein [Akkermansiaceae bacterium]